METIVIPVGPAIRYVEIEPPPLHLDAEHQIARWRHAADWWSGKIVPWVKDAAKALHAVEQVRAWTERIATDG